jgi:hypothetical protein
MSKIRMKSDSMPRMLQRTYRTLRLGTCDNVVGIGPEISLFFRTLASHNKEERGTPLRALLEERESSAMSHYKENMKRGNVTYRCSSCFNLDMENGISPLIELNEKSLKHEEEKRRLIS